MPMTKEAKHDALMTGTYEVCVRVLVKREDALEASKKLEKVAAELKGFVTSTGGYVEPAEHHEMDDLVEQLKEEVFDRL